MSPSPVPPAALPLAPAQPLSELVVGQCARVERLLPDAQLARRLLEVGFVPHAIVEVVARMWPGHDPIAVRIGGSTFALRRHEADRVLVQAIR